MGQSCHGEQGTEVRLDQNSTVYHVWQKANNARQLQAHHLQDDLWCWQHYALGMLCCSKKNGNWSEMGAKSWRKICKRLQNTWECLRVSLTMTLWTEPELNLAIIYYFALVHHIKFVCVRVWACVCVSSMLRCEPTCTLCIFSEVLECSYSHLHKWHKDEKYLYWQGK